MLAQELSRSCSTSLPSHTELTTSTHLSKHRGLQTMLQATTPKSSPEHLPGQHDHVLHTASTWGAENPKSSPLCRGNA